MTCQVQETCIDNQLMYFPFKQCIRISVIWCIFSVIAGNVVLACMILNAKWHFTIITTAYFFFWASTTSCFLFTLVKKNPCYLRRMDNSITLHNWVTETQIYEITCVFVRRKSVAHLWTCSTEAASVIWFNLSYLLNLFKGGCYFKIVRQFRGKQRKKSWC